MRTTYARLLGGAAALALAAGTAVSAQAAPGGDKGRPDNPGNLAGSYAGEYLPEDDFTANWTRADALEVPSDMGPDTLKPEIPDNFPIMTDDVWVWDTWPLTDLNMEPVSYKGWNVIFSLTAPRDVGFNDRHWVARIGYFFSRDAQTWEWGGYLHDFFSEGYGREWAGSAVISHGNQVQSFFTASGEPGTFGVSQEEGGAPAMLQRLAHSSGQIHADANGVYFTGFDEYDIIASADGEMYQTLEQSLAAPIIYAFRDPFVFRDPMDGEIYALFEGNNGGDVTEGTCSADEIGDVPEGHVVPEEAALYTGNIGLMQKTSKGKNDWSSWELLPPVLSAECTNQQTERPHLVIHEGQYYLWTISHEFTYAPGLTGPDGLYGFVGDSIRSDYQPLNGSGLVLGNPVEAPFQNYSDYVMPNLLVESFIDRIPTEDGLIEGGTLAPTLELALDGATSRLVQQWPYGYIPAMRNVAGPPIR